MTIPEAVRVICESFRKRDELIGAMSVAFQTHTTGRSEPWHLALARIAVDKNELHEARAFAHGYNAGWAAAVKQAEKERAEVEELVEENRDRP